MSEPAPVVAWQPKVSRAEALFPTLTAPQIKRLSAHGRVRAIAPGDQLTDFGDAHVSLFLVLSGAIQILRRNGEALEAFITYGPGQFSGEATLLTGRPSMSRIEAREAGEVVQVDREPLLGVIQDDPELSDILMRSLILRRQELIAGDVSDVVVIGSPHCSGTLRIREFLTRNAHPYHYVDLDRDADAQALLDRFHITAKDVPVLICRGETVLRNPDNRKIAKCLGFNEAIDSARVRDLVIIGGGPAGLAAAVYGASEGLDALVLETNNPGGQAGSSTKIENYLGFPNGISGLELTARAYGQAQKFGAEVMIAKGATRLACDRQPFAVTLDDGASIAARAVIIATGAQYRRPPIENLGRFEGSGVYYGATPMEAQVCAGEEVIVVGGGNSAGQAAVFLSATSRRVLMLVRGEGLADTMSRYLISRIEATENIELRAHAEIVALEGDLHIEHVRWRDHRTGAEQTSGIAHVFMMTGAVPNTGWIDKCLVMDDKGFIKTGPDLSPEDLAAAKWPLKRPPYLLESSRPGVFAVGDVRAGNIKRVASAVGEGSIAVAFVHQVLLGSPGTELEFAL